MPQKEERREIQTRTETEADPRNTELPHLRFLLTHVQSHLRWTQPERGTLQTGRGCRKRQ